jgi:hypothetical protein
MRNNNNTNTNAIRTQTAEILRENMTAFHQNFAAYNQNMRDYNQNFRMMLEMFQSVRPVSNPSLVNARTYTTLPRHDNLYTTTRGRMTGNYMSPIENLIYSTIVNGLLPYNESTEEERLTTEQISSLTRDIPYTSDMSHTTCHICQEEFEENEIVCQIIGCSHIFHKPELLRWLQTSNSCPVCRLDLTPNRQTNENTNTNNARRTNRTQARNTMNVPNTSQPREPSRNIPTHNTQNVEQSLTDIFTNLLSSVPTIDSSGNIVYTFDFPLNIH